MKDLIKYILNYRKIFFLFILILLNLIISSAVYLQRYNEINMVDEITYISTGFNLIEGTKWPFVRGPLISFVYALIYPLVSAADNWILASAIFGRIIVCIIVVLSLFKLGIELEIRKLCNKYIPVLLITIFPIFTINIVNPSYALYMAFSCIAFGQILEFERTKNELSLFKTSLGVTAALMARPDWALLVIFIFLVFYICGFKKVTLNYKKYIIFGLLPVVIIVGGYNKISRSGNGDITFGAAQKLYANFEGAQHLLNDNKGSIEWKYISNATTESDKYFGTAKENNYNILNAAIKNPNRFYKVIEANITKAFFPAVIWGYGGGGPDAIGTPYKDTTPYFICFFLFVFAIKGYLHLINKKIYNLVIIFTFWPVGLAVYIITLTSIGYQVFVFYLIFALASIGIYQTNQNLFNSRKELLFILLFIISLLFLDYYFINDWKLIYGLSISFLIINLLYFKITSIKNTSLLILTLLVSYAAIHKNYQNYFRLEWYTEKNGYELQAKYISDNYPKNTGILAMGLSASKLAKGWHLGIWRELMDIKSESEFINSLFPGTKLILIDPMLVKEDLYYYWSSINKYGNDVVREVWSTDDGTFKVLEICKDKNNLTAKCDNSLYIK